MARKLVLAGVILALVGSTLFGVTSVPVTRVTEEIHETFVVEAGSIYGPYDAGTGYQTRVLVTSALKAEVFVEGAGIYLTVNGHNTQDLRGLYIDESKNFVIETADDLYTFTFDNTRGTEESLVGFRLSEIWTGPMWVGSPPLFIAATLAPFKGIQLIQLRDAVQGEVSTSRLRTSGIIDLVKVS